eukprot:8019892-Pyramimonas_sp.AAC.1
MRWRVETAVQPWVVTALVDKPKAQMEETPPALVLAEELASTKLKATPPKAQAPILGPRAAAAAPPSAAGGPSWLADLRAAGASPPSTGPPAAEG